MMHGQKYIKLCLTGVWVGPKANLRAATNTKLKNIPSYRVSNTSSPHRNFTIRESCISRSLTVRTALFWAITQRIVVFPYRRFGTTYGSHLQGARNQDYWLMKMGMMGCPETSVINYHYTLRNSPEECSYHPIRGGSVKSNSKFFSCS
jgi:hypothetical protein